MCDYSLDGVASRPAKVADKLVTTRFWNTNTTGFCSIADPGVAVCLLPGTELAFEDQVEREPSGFQLSILKRHSQPLTHKVARFRQINLDNPCTHHDALEFPDGRIVLITHLRVGQRATVLQLPVPEAIGSAPRRHVALEQSPDTLGCANVNLAAGR